LFLAGVCIGEGEAAIHHKHIVGSGEQLPCADQWLGI
jgi:hypothetical protein